MRALATVQEPELHRDLVALNMVRDLAVNEGEVSFTIVLTTPACPLRNVMERDARNAVGALPGVKSVNIKWDARVAPNARLSGQLSMPARNVVAVASGKGGVGKTTVAVNVAVALAQSGAAVGLLDADIYGPNTPMMLGVKYKPVQNERGKLVPANVHGVELFSMGFLVRDDQPIIWRGPMLDKAIRQFLGDVEWGDLDYLLVDMPPGTGDAQLTVSQAFALAGAVIVTLPQAVSQADARRGLLGFRQMEVPILGVVENMSYLTLPNGEHMDVFGHGGGRKLADEVGVPFIGEVPMDPLVRVGGDTGSPIVVSHPDSLVAQALVAVAQDVAAKISVQNFLNQNNVVPITEIG
ncbi:MAG: Mrp/NBP35 family ATP-binding protein [Anaerolineales bacterium]